ncbi:hypothetical protein HN385_02415 [archaeon]|jgi:hypothetical protein|nr:hypothetical protein [archaeon]MBT3450771.1 hypothetical protein [archaeon]MBT6868816.1 hypothetical protein [archaeon]MBT7192963.1 hypothetical protein [archaeon]MBT7380929.1 hypothetical protein [archaeon]
MKDLAERLRNNQQKRVGAKVELSELDQRIKKLEQEINQYQIRKEDLTQNLNQLGSSLIDDLVDEVRSYTVQLQERVSDYDSVVIKKDLLWVNVGLKRDKLEISTQNFEKDDFGKLISVYEQNKHIKIIADQLQPQYDLALELKNSIETLTTDISSFEQELEQIQNLPELEVGSVVYQKEDGSVDVYLPVMFIIEEDQIKNNLLVDSLNHHFLNALTDIEFGDVDELEIEGVTRYNIDNVNKSQLIKELRERNPSHFIEHNVKYHIIDLNELEQEILGIKDVKDNFDPAKFDAELGTNFYSVTRLKPGDFIPITDTEKFTGMKYTSLYRFLDHAGGNMISKTNGGVGRKSATLIEVNSLYVSFTQHYDTKLNFIFAEQVKSLFDEKSRGFKYEINESRDIVKEMEERGYLAAIKTSKGDVEINAYSERLVQIGMGNYFIEVYFEDHKADSFNFDQLKDLLGYTNDKSLVSKLEKLDGYQINKNNTVSGEIMCDFIRKFKYSSNGKWMNRSSSDRYQKVKS